MAPSNSLTNRRLDWVVSYKWIGNEVKYCLELSHCAICMSTLLVSPVSASFLILLLQENI